MTTIPSNDARALLMADGDDGQALAAGLSIAAPIVVESCADPAALLQRMDEGIGLVLLASERLLQPPLFSALKAALGSQPDWSELPVITLAPAGMSAQLEQELRQLPGMVLLDQPVLSRTLQSCVEAALRARQRQYQLRDQLDFARRSNARLHASVQAKDEFLAVLAHELRNPLGAIIAAVRVLDSKPADFALARDVITRQSDQMRRLLEDLLDVTAVTSRPRSLQRKLQPMQPLIGAAVSAVQPALSAKGHTMELRQSATATQVNVDGARISQVLVNLLGNAIKYTPDGGHIALLSESRDGEFIVRVRDNGIGLAADALEKIFGMFAQVPEARAHADGGFGIGLALARGIAELHGGSLVARSAGLGQGSEFVLSLPTVDEPAPLPAPAPCAGVSEPRTILLVDDNEDALQALRAVLELSNHIVHCAGTGEEALRLCEQHSPQMAILDIGMPDMDGYELARRLRARAHGGIVLIALTGWSQPADRKQALAAGFDHHLAKPVDFDQLEQLMMDVADGR